MQTNPTFYIAYAVSKTRNIQRYAGHGDTPDLALKSAMSSRYFGHDDVDIVLVSVFDQPELDIEAQSVAYVTNNPVMSGQVLAREVRKVFKGSSVRVRK